MVTREQYHIESSVTHCKNWEHSIDDLREVIGKKFRGIPTAREGQKTDYAKGKNYFKSIVQTYQNVGFAPSKIQRIFVTWVVTDEDGLKKPNRLSRVRKRIFMAGNATLKMKP